MYNYWPKTFSWGFHPSERRFKRRDGITINHGRPRNKVRAKMARTSRRVNRRNR